MIETACWILRCDHRLLILAGTDAPSPFVTGAHLGSGQPSDAIAVGEWQGRPCYAADVDCFPEVGGAEPMPLRALFAAAGGEAFALAGRAVQLLDWQAQHRFCGRCGTPTEKKASEHAMQCPACGLLVYPRISPAIMVLVRDGDKLLLARSPRFKPGVFSALAGFVEPGETLEQCAVREVREEVGIEIANLRYFASQPWPFPNSLMVAFFADYAGGVITPDPTEIEAADWFALDALPLLPEPISISRQLIDAARRG
ncbi:NAD(+) diphosphatase [Dechloromonas sp. XY25]|uniref:NAD(+) diphosphatase n=1 Tax=Dechloromonas hankyongensis TaxID=2908002 RepID=A0ABS9K2U3_9RHOO|nr:NAD(+) diphosphatase [Dechloromonas hankyongensis]MCG2577487.1 NAD(+) diphosphatase [Dechloromonas hankyongensis]